MSARFSTFEEFYPYYLSEHRNSTCRKLHFSGSALVLALVAAAIVDREPLWLVAIPFVGYGFAWIGHFAYEKNRPATFTYPRWSFMGDWVMFWQLLSGKLSFQERDGGAGKGPDPA